jgi:uncharacterized protein RhaS with RHS repeats
MARDYDPATGRYVESDPIGLVGGSYSTYAYVNGNPLTLTDALGTKPGDSFPSAEAAAVDAFNYINTEPECHTHEYAGWVYKEWHLFGVPTYTYDEPTRLGPAGGVMPLQPIFHRVYAMFHNHPPLPGYDSDNYSPADENTADYDNIPSYLEIPNGVIKRYTPKAGIPRGGRVDTVAKTSCNCKGN